MHPCLDVQFIAYLHFVIFADGHAADVVFRSQVLGQRGAHQLTADVGGRIEVALAALPPGGGHERIALHGACHCEKRKILSNWSANFITGAYDLKPCNLHGEGTVGIRFAV